MVPGRSQNASEIIWRSSKIRPGGGSGVSWAALGLRTANWEDYFWEKGAALVPCGRYWVTFWRPLDFEGVSQPTFCTSNSKRVRNNRSPQNVDLGMETYEKNVGSEKQTPWFCFWCLDVSWFAIYPQNIKNEQCSNMAPKMDDKSSLGRIVVILGGMSSTKTQFVLEAWQNVRG